MDKRINTKVNLLMVYAAASTIVLAWLLLRPLADRNKKLQVEELTVKRMNVVGEDGGLRLVISNAHRQHSGRAGGQDQAHRERPAGILFFNNEGDECGGLLYEVDRQDSLTHTSMSFTMDQYHNDQVIQVLNDETYKNGQSEVFRGYRVNEYPKGATLASKLKQLNALKKIADPEERKAKLQILRKSAIERTRLFFGLDPDHRDGLFLFDHQGRPRMRIYVDSKGKPHFEIIDENGTVQALLKQFG